MTAPVTRPDPRDVSRAVRHLQRRRSGRRALTALIVLLIAAALLLTTVCRPMTHAGRAMLPAYADGQLILVNTLDRTPERGQVIAFARSGVTRTLRVAALPGDTVALTDGALLVNGDHVIAAVGTQDMPASLTVPAGYCFVLGDNPVEALDSRSSQIGLVNMAEVAGTVW